MNLHQFRFVQEAVRCGFNLTDTAKALHTSQPGISKAIIELEDELGVEIFARHGKRIRGLTEPGKQVLRSVDLILREIGNLRRIGQQFSHQDSGTLRITTTHTQARYVLPTPIATLRQAYPKVSVSLHQGSPTEVALMLLNDQADLGVATEALAEYEDLITLPCYEWQHMVVVPRDHPLAAIEALRLEDLAEHPLMTYTPAYTGRHRIDMAFATRRIKPNVVLEAIDSDVLKTYAELGMGVGIVAEMATRAESLNPKLVALPAGHLFGRNVARVAFKRGAYLRHYVLRLAEGISDRLNTTLILKALQGHGEHFDL